MYMLLVACVIVQLCVVCLLTRSGSCAKRLIWRRGGVCAQVQKEAGLLIGVDSNGAVVTEDESIPATAAEATPVKRPRGRPRKYPKTVSSVCFYLCFGGVLYCYLPL